MKKECTCSPTDLMPFGECVCGFKEFQKQQLVDMMKQDEESGMYDVSSSREVFALPELSFVEQSKKVYENELLRLITWLQQNPSTKEFYGMSPELLLSYYFDQRENFAKNPKQ